jgi:hypothetical protein
MFRLCKTCDLFVNRLVINCYKLSPIHKFGDRLFFSVWIMSVNRSYFHNPIHTLITLFLSVKSTLSTLPTGSTITTILKKGSL